SAEPHACPCRHAPGAPRPRHARVDERFAFAAEMIGLTLSKVEVGPRPKSGYLRKLLFIDGLRRLLHFQPNAVVYIWKILCECIFCAHNSFAAMLLRKKNQSTGSDDAFEIRRLPDLISPYRTDVCFECTESS